MSKFPKIIICAVGIAILATTAYLRMEASSPSSSSCPEGFEAWKAWRTEALQSALSRRYSSGLNAIQAKIQSCRSEWNDLGPKQACFANLNRLTLQTYQTHQRGRSLGLSSDDASYLARQASLGIGTLPPAFLEEKLLRRMDEASNFTSIAQELERLGPQGTIAFPYESKHLPSVDDASVKGRLFLYLPGERLDLFAQYAIGRGKKDRLPNAISVISVLKLDGSQRPLPRPQVYYNDIWRQRGESIRIVNRIDANRRLENCYNCHKSPFISIFPDRSTFDFEQFGDRLTEANRIMSQYASAEYVGIEPSHYGPSLGLSETNACIQQNPALVQLTAFFNCQDCHNGRERGSLNFPSALDSQVPGSTSLTKLYVEDYGLMPPLHAELSADDRRMLHACLVEDFYGDFTDLNKGRFNQWLLQPDCG